MFYKILLISLLILFPEILFPQVITFIKEEKGHVLFQVSSKYQINLIESETIAGGVALTLAGESMRLPDKFSQRSLNTPFIKYIIQNQLIKNHAQFILKNGKSKFIYFTNSIYDSLYHFQIHIFPENKAGRNHLALYLKGLEYHKNNDIKNAINYYRKSIKVKSQNGNAYYKAGQIRLLKKESDKALINFNKAVKFKTDSIKAYYYLADIYKKLNNQKKAQNFLNKYNNTQKTILVARIKDTPKPAANDTKIDSSAVNVVASSENTFFKVLIVFLTLAIIIFVAFIIIRKNKKSDEEFEYDEEEELTEHEDDSFKHVFQQQKDEIIHEEDYIAEEESGDPELTVEENINRTLQHELTDEKTKKTKEMELGVGELDLALNIKAKLKNKRKLAGKEELIIEMYNHGMNIEEIAKELNLNFGEVDLVIGLNKHRLLKDRR